MARRIGDRPRPGKRYDPPYNSVLRVEGVSGMIANIYSAQEWLQRRIRWRTVNTAQRIKNRAKGLAPVDRGYLRSSITYRVSDDELVFEVYCDPEVFAQIPTGAEEPYDVFVEFGTSTTRAQPFLYPAWEAEIGGYVDGIGRDIRKAIQMIRSG